MLGFWTQQLLSLLHRLLDWIKWDLGNSSMKGELPITLTVLVCALTGALLAGFTGALIGGVAGVLLSEICIGREPASRVH